MSVLIVGARPNFMKAAPIIKAIKTQNEGKTTSESIRHILVHTGQHYDQLMSDSFFSDLNLPSPDFHLGVGSGSHAIQTAEIMRKFEQVLLEERPDVLIVVGDVNSTLACSLVAAKICLDGVGARPLIAHVEAGLRSFDRTMPEEINRILTDQLSDLLFVTEESGLRNLTNEGISPDKVHFVGNTMIDSLLAYEKKAQSSTIIDQLGLRNPSANDCSPRGVAKYALLTLHRPANVDDCDTFMGILDGLEELSRDLFVVFPIHPRTQNRIREFGLEHRFDWSGVKRDVAESVDTVSSRRIRVTEPLGYLDFLCLMSKATLVVTDSGGIQEETTCLGVPCVTVRENTERPVTLEVGTNILAGTSPRRILAAVKQQLDRKPVRPSLEKWDGQSATRILNVIRGKSEINLARPATLTASLAAR